MIRLNEVYAGIVLYNPNLERLAKVIESIEGDVQSLLLIDNGSFNFDNISEAYSSRERIFIIANKRNEGIARALNQICQYGIDKGYKWCLTLDQDTICPPKLVELLYRYADDPNHGIICPAVHYEGINMDTKRKEGGEYVYACMTSASLTNLEAWKKVGGFREDYFIDFVDNEYCMKLKLSGYKVFRTFDCSISHQLGESREIKFLWWSTKGTIHSSLRCYYMIRNNILFIRQYSKELNIIKEYTKVGYIAFGQLLYSRYKAKDLAHILKGIKDGFKGKTGKYEG